MNVAGSWRASRGRESRVSRNGDLDGQARLYGTKSDCRADERIPEASGPGIVIWNR